MPLSSVINICRGIPGIVHDGGFAFDVERCVHAGDQALRGGFFIARCAVELSGSVKTGDIFESQGGIQLCRIYTIVFDGVSGTHGYRVFEAYDGAEHLELYVCRHG